MIKNTLKSPRLAAAGTAAQAMKSRLDVICKALADNKADCLVVAKPANVTYITGFTGGDSWTLVLPEKIILITDSRYTEQAARECPLCKIISRTESMVKTVARLLKKQPAILKITVENSISLADFDSLQKLMPARLNTLALIVESARRTKTEDEIAAIRQAAKIALKAFEITKRKIRKGMTENTLAGLLDFEIRKLGGQNSFESIVAFGPNASRPHHQPTGRKLSPNDSVLIDFGVRFNSYCSDITRCFAVGNPSPLFKKVYSAVENAQAAALKMVKAGAEITAVDSAARNVIKKANLPVYGHGTGHGLGLEVHELPVVSKKIKEKLQTADVITVEPAVYLPGSLGVRLEDDALVTDNGFILLTSS